MVGTPYDIYNPFGTDPNNSFSSVGGYNVPATADPAGTAAAANAPIPANAFTEAGPWGAAGTKSGWAPLGNGTGTGTGTTGTDTDFKFGFNPSSMNMIMGAIGTIGGLWATYEQIKNQKQTLELQRKGANINFLNQIKQYNMKLKDRTRVRTESMGWTEKQGKDWVAENQLTYTPL